MAAFILAITNMYSSQSSNLISTIIDYSLSIYNDISIKKIILSFDQIRKFSETHNFIKSISEGNQSYISSDVYLKQ